MNPELEERTDKQIATQQIGIFIQKLEEETEKLKKAYKKMLIKLYILRVLTVLFGISACYFLYKSIEPLFK